MNDSKRQSMIIEGLRMAFFAARIREAVLAADAAKWITVHPNGKGMTNSGENAKGTPVLLDEETGEVLGGMGGKFTGKHISEACSNEPTENSQHIIRRGQEMRKDPAGFEAEQQRKMKESEEAVAKAQEEAAAQAPGYGPGQNHFSSISTTSSVQDITTALAKQGRVTHDTETEKGRYHERQYKREAIQKALEMRPEVAAAAYAEHVKKVGPPDKEAVKDNKNAQAYIQKLLPNAYYRVDDRLAPEVRAEMVNTIHSVLTLFPAIGNHLTSIYDVHKISAMEQEVNIANKYAKKPLKVPDSKLTKEEKAAIKQAQAKAEELEKELRETDWRPGGSLHHDALSRAERFGQTELASLKGKGNLNGVAKRMAKIGIPLTAAKRIANSLFERHKGYDKLDEQAIKEMADAIKEKDIKELCKSKVDRVRNDIYRKHSEYSYVNHNDTKTTFDYGEGCTYKDTGSNTYAYIAPYTQQTDSGRMAITGSLCIAHAMTGGDYSRTEAKIDESLRECEKVNYHPKRRSGISATQAIITHELGHVLDCALSMGSGKCFSDDGEIKTIYDNAVAELPPIMLHRPYWADTPQELLAETLAAKLTGEPSAMTPLFTEVYDKLMSRYKEKFGNQ